MTKPFRVLRHKMSVEAQQQAKEKAAKLLTEMALLESDQENPANQQDGTRPLPSSQSVTSSRLRQKI